MTVLDRFLRLCTAYEEQTGLSRARLSTVLLSRGTRLQQLRDGGDIGSRRLDAAMQWLSDNWPADAVWPDDIPRPAPSAPDLPEAAE